MFRLIIRSRSLAAPAAWHWHSSLNGVGVATSESRITNTTNSIVVLLLDRVGESQTESVLFKRVASGCPRHELD